MIITREALKEDYPAIYSLMINELGYPDLDENETLKRLESFRKNNDVATFVAVLDGTVAGFIGVGKVVSYEMDGDNAQILALAVSENARRMGVGTALVKCIEGWSFAHGMKSIIVNTNEIRHDAHAFYENCGYRKYKVSYRFVKNL